MPSRVLSFLVLAGAPDDDAVIADQVVIESVQRMAKLEHDEIGDVDDVIDAGGSGGFEAIF